MAIATFCLFLFGIFRKFPRKTTLWKCFLNKVLGMISWEICEIFRTAFTTNNFTNGIIYKMTDE